MSEIKVNSIKGVGASAAAITVNNTDGTCTDNITNNLSNRNMVINGGMICSQRGSSFASITNAYCLDRFKFRNSNGISGTFTVSQSTDTPDGFGNSLKVDVGTADAAIAAGEVFNIGTKFEGQNLQQLAKGTSSAKKSVLSFYVKTNKTGQYSVLIYDGDNSRMFSTTYTVSNTNWNRYTIDVAADTTGAYNNDNGASLEIYWYLGLGSDRTSAGVTNAWAAYASASVGSASQVNFADSTSNEFYITGIQYEVNESGVATDFEHRSLAVEKKLCERYFTVLNSFSGIASAADQFQGPLSYDMRATPSVALSPSGQARITDCAFSDFDASTVSALNSYNATSTGLRIAVTGFSGMSVQKPMVWLPTGTNQSDVHLSAEL